MKLKQVNCKKLESSKIAEQKRFGPRPNYGKFHFENKFNVQDIWLSLNAYNEFDHEIEEIRFNYSGLDFKNLLAINK